MLIAGIVHWQQVPVVVGFGQHLHTHRQPFHIFTFPLFAAKSRDTVFLVSVLRASPLGGSLAVCVSAKASEVTNVSRMYFEAAHLLTQSSEEGRCCVAQAATAP